jgi:hypothetical protein
MKSIQAHELESNRSKLMNVIQGVARMIAWPAALASGTEELLKFQRHRPDSGMVDRITIRSPPHLQSSRSPNRTEMRGFSHIWAELGGRPKMLWRTNQDSSSDSDSAAIRSPPVRLVGPVLEIAVESVARRRVRNFPPDGRAKRAIRSLLAL